MRFGCATLDGPETAELGGRVAPQHKIQDLPFVPAQVRHLRNTANLIRDRYDRGAAAVSRPSHTCGSYQGALHAEVLSSPACFQCISERIAHLVCDGKRSDSFPRFIRGPRFGPFSIALQSRKSKTLLDARLLGRAPRRAIFGTSNLWAGRICCSTVLWLVRRLVAI
jgi:hypothetical protein